jgi:four helix bundle protein
MVEELKMKKKTPNAQHRTPNIEWMGDGRVKEDAPFYSASDKRASTLNAQPAYAEGFGVAGAHLSRRSESEGGTPNAQRQKNARFDLEERLLEFSARIIRLVDALPNTRAANHVAGQLLRCGTSPYGNHGEVEAAESRKDFIHKLKICLKELKETRRWLWLVKKAVILPPPKLAPILHETEELIMIFFASIRTAEKNTR